MRLDLLEGIAFVLIFFLSIVATWLLVRMAPALGLMDIPNSRSSHQWPVPRAGGLVVIAGTLVGAGSMGSPINLWFWVAALVIFVGGYLDDQKKIASARAKLLFQVLGIGIYTLGLWLLHRDLFLAIQAFALLLLMVNAFNLMDNMNGLVIGLSLLIFSFFRLVLDGSAPVQGLLTGAIPALLALLIFNFPNARIFLGDQGSQLLGFLAGAMAVEIFPISKMGSWWTLVPFLLFIADTIVVVLTRLKNKKPIYIGDQNHLSHRLVRMGLSPARAVTLLWVAQVLSLLLMTYLVSDARVTNPNLTAASRRASSFQSLYSGGK